MIGLQVAAFSAVLSVIMLAIMSWLVLRARNRPNAPQRLRMLGVMALVLLAIPLLLLLMHMRQMQYRQSQRQPVPAAIAAPTERPSPEGNPRSDVTDAGGTR